MRAPVLTLRDDISLIEVSPGSVKLVCSWGVSTLNRVTPGLLAALRTMLSDGATEEQLSQLVQEQDGTAALAPFYYRLNRWRGLGWVCYSLFASGQLLARVVPMAGGFRLSAEPVGMDRRVRLSRFAFCRREGDMLVLESPLSPVRTLLPGGEGAALVGELAQPFSPQELAADRAGLAAETAREFVSLLRDAALVGEVGQDGTLPEDEDPVRLPWEFHDLLFHSRSRPGRHDAAFGATLRFLGRMPPPPAVKTRMSDDTVQLCKPDLARLATDDPPFTRVLEERTSRREYGSQPITARQLGEFLYRVARVRSTVAPDPAAGLHYQVTSRPYPSGGACYELELYVTVNVCVDLVPGIYHYAPLEHQLHRLPVRKPHVDALLNDARVAAALPVEPQILITLASRFQRLSWKYSGLAYALSLKNAGVLMQTMYLVATAMGLAPCALGTGNSDLFETATGTGCLLEPPVGEFLLGSKRPTVLGDRDGVPRDA
jgi:SagB-type dehydrogenase family enzyme